jgi:hypothetical protein
MYSGAFMSKATTFAALLAVLPLGAGAALAQEPSQPAKYRAMVDKYCISCHDEVENRGGLSLDDVDFSKVGENAKIFEHVVTKIRGSSMPPVGKARPDPATYQGFAGWLETELDHYAAAHPNAGRPAPYRLNRTEYKNAIRDLLGLDVDVRALMAPDSSSYGFDNIADVLGLSPALLEGYLASADKISALAVGDPTLPQEDALYRVSQRLSQNEHIEGLPLGTRGGLKVEHYFPLDGTYEIGTTFLKNTLSAIRGLEFEHQFEVSVDGRQAKLVTMGGKDDYTQLLVAPEDLRIAIEERARVRVPLTAGTHSIVVTFPQKTGALEVDQLQPFENINFDPVYYGGIPSVEQVMIKGPFDAKAPTALTPGRKAIFTCKPANAADEARCADQILSRLARKAYRRPVTESDMTVLRTFYKEGRAAKGSFDGGIQMGLRRILASPDFIFRMEHDPPGATPGVPFRVSDLELASRLSFFLWSSIPDGELIDLATKGTLHDDKVLTQQVRRMLADPRSESLSNNFAAQWLRLRNLDAVQPDSYFFPNFDETLRDAFHTETVMFFDSIKREDRSIVDLVSADYTFMNERLARHYGVPGVYGSDFRRVHLADGARRGLLGQGSILTVTSMANRTSVVKRGQWVLETLLANPPPSPPDNVPALKENAPDSVDRPSLRTRMEQHRADASCSVCHNIMDPIGFSMEVFDGIGAKRAKDESGVPIDASGNLASGQAIDGVEELRAAIAAEPRHFVGAFTEKLLTYALGRGLEYYDQPVVRSIVDKSEAANYRFSTVVMEIARSMPFQMKMPATPQRQLTANK